MQLKSFDDITPRYRHIYLAPHFDDAVFSCGGTIGVQVSVGLTPLVITVFAGMPAPGNQLSELAAQVHREMGFRPILESAVRVRREEDASALDYLHADYLWLDYPDAIYRGSPYYTNKDELIGGEVNPGDLWIDRQLAENLVKLSSRLPDTVWYAPFGIGRHVDHQIVASAADRLVSQGANVKFYEDFPYVLEQGALQARLKELGNDLEPAFVEMSEMLPLRQEASAMYTSQVAVNFGSKEAMFRTMDDYTHDIRPVQTVHLERYWTIV